MSPDARHSSRLADAETPESVDAAWAHNRWPTIGLYTGAGLGLLMGIAFVSGWLLTIGFIVALAVTGCLVGLGLASLVYRGSARVTSKSLGGELEKAAEDHGGDAAQENGPGGEDRAGRAAGADRESDVHGKQA